jgi:hypothetical protein
MSRIIMNVFVEKIDKNSEWQKPTKREGGGIEFE